MILRDSPWAKLILREQIIFSVSKFIEQIFAHNKFACCEQILWAILFSKQFFWAMSNFFVRRQQHENHAGRSSFAPARHGTEMVSPPAGACITFIHDLQRIAGPSWQSVKIYWRSVKNCWRRNILSVDDNFSKTNQICWRSANFYWRSANFCWRSAIFSLRSTIFFWRGEHRAGSLGSTNPATNLAIHRDCKMPGEYVTMVTNLTAET